MNIWYDNIGKGYSDLRVPDARIASLVHSALGAAKTVANIGAGTGSYEPRDRDVIAIEPSSLMLDQYRGQGHCVRGVAENLPLADNSVDASLAILTMHHWRNWKQGLAELFRVSRTAVVLLTHQPDLHDFWLLDYFPEIREIDMKIFATISEIEDESLKNNWQNSSIKVPVPHDCTDGFLGAYWRRPDAYFNEDVRRSISTFNLLDAGLVKKKLGQLRRDLKSGRWDDLYGHLRNQNELDIGYRIIKMVPS